MVYRQEIDGLRAAAILPVMLYHTGLPLLGGGFVGVDVFFVISGYLITSLILDDLNQGKFSILRFYERRVRRILPALISMIAGTVAAGWFLLAPDDYRNLGRSAIAALLSFSNFFFFAEAGYFDTPAAEKPLLHTWSLGIEEQYYLVFPLLLLLLSKYWPRPRLAVTAVICAISLALCVALTADSPTAAFFLPQTRCWELLVGSLLAMWKPRLPATRWVVEAGATIGAALIIFSIATFSDATAFPGWTAAVPVIGAALIIFCADRNTVIGISLSHPVPVFVGKISYSLYLWHLPILAFGHYLGLGALSPLQTAFSLAATFIIAVLSWRWIEQPARNSDVISRAMLLRAVGVCGGLVYATGLALIALEGVPNRIGPEALRNLALIPERNDDRQSCYAASRAPHLPDLCAIGAAADGTPSFVLWGDSHAEAMRPAVDAAARRYGRSGVFAGERGCPPMILVERLDWTDCRGVNSEILAMITREPGIRSVIVAARWGMWAERHPYLAEPGPSFEIRLDGSASVDPLNNHAVFAAGLERTLAALRNAGKEIWIVGPIPEVGFNVPRYYFLQSIGIGVALDIRPDARAFAARQEFALSALTGLAETYDAKMILPHRELCDAEKCRIQQEGHALYFDDDHLSRFGAETLNGLFDPIFAERAVDVKVPQVGPVQLK